MKDELIMRALRMLEARRDYWNGYHNGMYIAYDSAVTILEAAIEDDIATLDNMDYYKGNE